MKKYFIFLFLSVFLFSCGAGKSEQENIIREKKEKMDQMIRLGREALPLMGEGMRYQTTDSLKSASYFRLALNKFLAAVAIDTSFKKMAIYLPDLYSLLHMPDSAAYWRNWIGNESR